MLRNVILISGLAVLAACGDPLDGLDRISDVDLSQNDPAAAALPTGEEVAREGFFGTTAATGEAVTVAGGTPVIAPTPPPAPKRKGLLGLLRRNQPEDSVAPVLATPDTDADAIAQAVAVSEAATTGGEDIPAPTTEVASIAPDPVPAPKRRGLFRGVTKKDKPRTGPDARDVTYGTVLANGTIARVCDARRKPLGRKIENATARGFALFDSDPGSAVARTWYVTGFDDGCPRQFTAANALLGSASLYEQLHYGPTGKHLPYGVTDKAYEGIKRKVCKVGKSKACGPKINKMEKSTFFVSAYASFVGPKRWTEVLIHDGEVLALAVKSNN